MTIAPQGLNGPRIAVIGGGISGMGAAYALSDSQNVTLYEAAPRLGGHARTVLAGKAGTQPVDTGFIVFNYANYPNMADLFDALNVPVVKSNMSFGASLRGGRIEYGLANFSAIFAQKRNLANPNFLRMLRDILKFNARGLELAQDPTMTISEFLQRLGSGPWFRDYYLLPLSGAIWSTPTEKILDFPARAMLQFFENHALLSHTGQHQWYTVQGGSQEYVQRLEAALVDRGVAVRVKTPVSSVIRHDRQVEIRSAGHPPEYFDEVVFATHSDDSLRLLEDPSAFEVQALGAVKYQPNNITLHCDERIMPKRRACWSSWVYTETEDKTSDQIDLTYWMNSLQPIPLDDPHFVTLNSTRPIREDKIYDQVTLRHPVYDLHALAAQEKIATRNGTNRTWFCGAWMKNGFHEDGLSSGLDVAQSIILKSALAVAAE